jgi:hypothetical protein
MMLTNQETDVLQLLDGKKPSDANAFNINSLYSECTKRDWSNSQFVETVLNLQHKRLIEIRAGEYVVISEPGIAALRAL